MSGRDWLAIVVVWAVGLFGIHQYDETQANEAATAAAQAVHVAAVKAANVVYHTQLRACHDTNPVRGAQHKYYVTIAVGRATSARTADAGRPKQRAVDQDIARVAWVTAKTYTDRYGSRPNGELNCLVTTEHP